MASRKFLEGASATALSESLFRVPTTYSILIVYLESTLQQDILVKHAHLGSSQGYGAPAKVTERPAKVTEHPAKVTERQPRLRSASQDIRRQLKLLSVKNS